MIAKHPQASLIALVSWLVVFGWGCLIGLLFSIIFGMLKYSDIALPAFMVFALALVASTVFSLALSMPVKCPNCGEKILRQTHKKKHPDAICYPGLDYWSSAILNCLIKRQLTCMYCGNTYTCK